MLTGHWECPATSTVVDGEALGLRAGRRVPRQHPQQQPITEAITTTPKIARKIMNPVFIVRQQLRISGPLQHSHFVMSCKIELSAKWEEIPEPITIRSWSMIFCVLFSLDQNITTYRSFTSWVRSRFISYDGVGSILVGLISTYRNNEPVLELNRPTRVQL